MARISGLEKKQAPWHLRWFYCVMRKMFGKDLTPVKLQIAFENYRARLTASSMWRVIVERGANAKH